MNSLLKNTLLLLTAFTALPPFCAHADSLPERYHGVSNYVIIDNAAAYPNYDFYITGNSRNDYPETTLVTSTPASITIENQGSLIAVKKSDEQYIKPHTTPDCPECGNDWFKNGNADYIMVTPIEN